MTLLASQHGSHDDISLDTATVDTIAILEAQVAIAAPERADVVWDASESGRWVASYGGYHGGIVDQQGTHFFASDTFGQYVGDFVSAEIAMDRLEEHLHRMLPSVIRPVR